MDYKEEFAILSNPDLFKNSSFNINDKKKFEKNNRDKNRINWLTKTKFLSYLMNLLIFLIMKIPMMIIILLI